MNKGSIFDFLKNDKKKFKNIRRNCFLMEEMMFRREVFSINLARQIIEECIVFLAKDDSELRKKYFNDKTNSPKLDFLTNECKRKNIISSSIKKKYDTVRRLGNDAVHNTLKKVSSNQLKTTHKQVFDIVLHCFNFFNIEKDVDYSCNLDYLKESKGISKKDVKEYLNSVHKSDVDVEILTDTIANNEIYLTKDNLMVELEPFKDYINNLEKFKSDFESKKFITKNDLSLLLSNFNDSIIDEINQKITDNYQKQNSELLEILEDLNNQQISFNEINNLIKENEDSNKKEMFVLMKKVAEDIATNKLNSYIKEFSKIPLVDDETNEVVVNKPVYEVFEDEFGFSLREVDEIKLDAEQEEAVTYNGDKPLIIDAGPGSGKTRVIIERVVYLINELNVNPSSILLITFTNKAADELKERLKGHNKLTFSQIEDMKVGTIHSFCRHVLNIFSKYPYNYLVRNGERSLFLQKHRHSLGFEKEAFFRNFEMNNIYNKYNEYMTFNVDSEELINFIKDEVEVSVSYSRYIEDFYNNHEIWEYPDRKEIKILGFNNDLYNARYLKIAESFPDYLKLLEKEKVCDQNYLLLKAYELLLDDNNLNALPFTNILIDEFQDTDPNQMKIFKLLLKIKDTFTIVGDIDQSIYGFRGAYPNFFAEWAKDPSFKRIVLKNNYRSTRDIVNFNELLIKQQRPVEKELVAVNGSSSPVYNLLNQDDQNQAKNIAKILKHLKETGKIEKYSDVGIFFRSNNPKIRTILDEFDKEDIPYYLKGIEDFIYQNEVKATLALFWYLMPHDNLELRKYEDEWLSLHAFTDVYYDASDIFKLSKKTKKVLRNLENEYRKDLKNTEKKVYYKVESKTSRIKSLKGVFNRSDDILKEIFKIVEKPNLTKLSRDDFIELGIRNKNDLNLFEKLNEINNLINNEKINVFDKPTTLELFYKLININGFLDNVLDRDDYESRKIGMNISLISQIIQDYEHIMGKWNYGGLFNYLSGILHTYSCPMNDLEDNSDKVHVMTIHKSKGLEYPVVIVASLENEHFPKIFSHEKYNSRYIYGKPNFYTPFHCLEYKPNTIYEEELNYNNEEERIIYVATTRAKELLILSNLDNRHVPMPFIISDLKKKYRRLHALDMKNLEVLKKVKPRKINQYEQFTRLSFENINYDFLNCPIKYYLLNNVKYRNFNKYRLFIDNLMHIILNNIHRRSLIEEINENTIRNIFLTIMDSYSISSDNIYSEIAGLLDNLIDYWNIYGNNYEILKSNIHAAMSLDYCDLTGQIDLIIKNNDNEISIVKFITSFEEINDVDLFMENLCFYGALIRMNKDFKDYNIKNIILHSIKENKQKQIEFNLENEKNAIDAVYYITKKIVSNIFSRNMSYCQKCEFNNVICKYGDKFLNS